MGNSRGDEELTDEAISSFFADEEQRETLRSTLLGSDEFDTRQVSDLSVGELRQLIRTDTMSVVVSLAGIYMKMCMRRSGWRNWKQVAEER
jgi:hypothetical protein